jgi:transposase
MQLFQFIQYRLWGYNHWGYNCAVVTPASLEHPIIALHYNMSRRELSDEEWAVIQPQLRNQRPGPGRKRADDRHTLSGTLIVLKTGCRWEDVARAYGSPTTCRRRFQTWVESTLATIRVSRSQGRSRTHLKDLVADKAYDSREFPPLSAPPRIQLAPPLGGGALLRVDR